MLANKSAMPADGKRTEARYQLIDAKENNSVEDGYDQKITRNKV